MESARHERALNLRRWMVSCLFTTMASLVISLAVRAEVMKWTIDGTQREALVFSPSKNAGAVKEPVVFAFHWHGGTMQEAAEGMRFQNLWPEAIVVYMQGLRTRIYVDPLGLQPGWQQEPGQFGDRDLKFFDAVLATLRARFSVDDRRIYATGFSNGGIFTYLLWDARAKTFAAFASVAAQIFPGLRLTEPKPILHIAGEQDQVVPFKDQVRSIETARELNGGSEKGKSCGEDCTIYPSAKGAPVMTYIHGGGHLYPPGASEMIVKFFESYALAQAREE
jgi:polyhydroxybutyrate depolymerase